MFFKNNFLGILWSLAIISVCIIPGSNLPGTSFLNSIGFDKIVHGFFYLVLVILISKGLTKKSNYAVSKKTALIISYSYAFILGVGIEFLQANFIKGRAGDFYDVLANNVGAIIGVVLFLKFNKGKV